MSDADGHRAGADELLRLLGTVQDWAARTFPSPGEHETTCQWCPLCQLMAVVRGERPEVSERVAEAAGTLLTVLRSWLDASAAASGAESGSAPGGAQRVQRIDLGDLPSDV